jgi:phosphatidylserine/phosphatidylglycerophosphate/cardiolipin synthase-like enzyme
MSTRFLSNREIYELVILRLVPQAKERLWIATADIKDLYVGEGNEMVPFLQTLAGFLRRKISVRLIHAKEPGPMFRQDFDRFPVLRGLEHIICPRVHFKCVIVDGRAAYFGSANLTGAGMGAKGKTRRNFENGVLTDDPALVGPLCEQFDEVWRGGLCRDCGRKKFCADGPMNGE